MGNYTPDLCKWGFRKEVTFRGGGLAGTQATPVALAADEVLPLDYLEGDLEIPEPYRKREEFNAIGMGQNVGAIIEKGFEKATKDLEMKMQSGIATYYFLGSCSSGDGVQLPAVEDTITVSIANNSSTTIILTNTALSFEKNALAGFSIMIVVGAVITYHRIVSHAATTTSALTLTITPVSPSDAASGKVRWMTNTTGTGTVVVKAGSESTNTLTTVGLGTLAVNALAGKQIKTDEAGTPVYVIISNTAVTGAEMVLKLNKKLGASASGAVVTLYTYPYIHTITEANTQPSMVLHAEQNLTSYEIRKDLLGTLVQKVTIKIEKGGEVKQTASIICSRSMAGTAQTTFPDPIPDVIYTWDMVARTGSQISLFTYNGTNVEGSTIVNFLNECDSIEITMDRTIEYEHVLGDEYAYKVKYGLRTYSIKCHYTPSNYTLYNLINTKLRDYAGDICFTCTLERVTGNYLKYTFNSLYLAAYPNKLVTQDGDKQVAVDFELKGMPGQQTGGRTAGTLAVVAADQLDKRFYEEALAART